jgi:hypothetical protein
MYRLKILNIFHSAYWIIASEERGQFGAVATPARCQNFALRGGQIDVKFLAVLKTNLGFLLGSWDCCQSGMTGLSPAQAAHPPIQRVRLQNQSQNNKQHDLGSVIGE